MINVVSSEEETYLRCKALLTSEQPHFLGRIGGSDTDALMSYKTDPSDLNSFEYNKNRVQSFNGFYEFAGDIDESYIKYLDTLNACYRKASDFFIVSSNLLTLFYPYRIGLQYLHEDKKHLEDYSVFLNNMYNADHDVNFYAYDFVERLLSSKFTFFHLLAELLPGKKVLVISPFSESITAQQSKKQNLFKNYNYPDFELYTYQTPVTYSGLPRELYPDTSWHETVDRMKSDIQTFDFDIALLACGSYAMPLGLHVRDICKKHAVYVGGCLQLFFGVMGRRWQSGPFFMQQLNPEQFILPIEGEKFKKHTEINEGTQTEAFGAYF